MLKKSHFLLITLVILGALNGCKKGDNDPFLSLKSRKARLTGIWELQTWEGSVNITNSVSNDPNSLAYSFLEGKLKVTTTLGEYTNVNEAKYEHVYEFFKNGKFSIETKKYYEDGELMTLQNIAGTWFFNGKSKTADLKKGESVTLNVTSDRTLFLDPEGNEIQLNIQVSTGLSEIRTLLLKRLSNKELELNLDETHTTTSTDGTNSISTSVATSGIQTFKKK